jgi:hypothetical protein
MPAKKKIAKKSPAKKKLSPYHVGLTKETEHFWNFKPTMQSVYWVLIGIAVIGTAIINFNTNTQVMNLIEDIRSDQLSNEIDSAITETKTDDTKDKDKS